MRLQTYINEAGKASYLDPTRENVEKILDESKEWMRLVKGNPTFRNTKEQSDQIIIKQPRQDREPQGTDWDAFKNFNTWAVKNNVPPRNKSVSTASVPFNELGGHTYYFFPQGKIKYGWVYAEDFNIDDSSTGWHMDTPMAVWGTNVRSWDSLYFKKSSYLGRQVDLERYETGEGNDPYLDYVHVYSNDPDTRKVYAEDIKKYMIHGNKNIRTALKKNFEIWVECETYALIPGEVWRKY